jgi:WD40 repeat protein
MRVLCGFEGEARCLAFRGDGEVLASGGSDRVVHLWDSNSVDAGRWMVDGEGGSSPSTNHHPPSTNARVGLALSPDGARLASLSPGKGVRVWEAATEQKVLELPESGRLNVVAWSPDGGRLAAGSSDTTIRLWDAATGSPRATLEGSALPVTALAFAPAGRLLASASAIGCDVWLWDAERGKPALLVPDAVDGCAIEALAFQPQGELLAVGGIDWLATGGTDGAVHVWDVVQPARRLVLPGGARCLAFHPAGHLLAAASLTRAVRVWDARNGRLLRELSGHEDAVNCVAYSPNGRYLASVADDHTLRLWDAESGALLGVTELDTQVKVLCFAPDSRSLFTGNGNSSCYQLKTQRLLNDCR